MIRQSSNIYAQRRCCVEIYISRKRTRRRAAPIQASLATTTAAVLAAVPVSIAVDAALDRATDRIGRVTNAATPSGVRLYMAQPPEGAPPRGGGGGKGRPAVVLIHQIFGLQPQGNHDTAAPHSQEVGLCDDLAAAGYVAAAPDTFGGAVTTWIPRALAVAYPRALKPGAGWGVAEVADAVEWLKRQPGVDPGRVAVAGFCYGGGAALRFAATHPTAARAVGVFYGRPLLETAEGGGGGGGGAAGGPAALGAAEGYAALAGGGAAVFGVFGGRDAQFPPPMVDAFEAGLASAGVAHEVRRYAQQGHAFIGSVDDTRRAGSDAADAWGAFLQFLENQL